FRAELRASQLYKCCGRQYNVKGVRQEFAQCPVFITFYVRGYGAPATSSTHRTCDGKSLKHQMGPKEKSSGSLCASLTLRRQRVHSRTHNSVHKKWVPAPLYWPTAAAPVILLQSHPGHGRPAGLSTHAGNSLPALT